jgi:hypothetical protein
VVRILLSRCRCNRVCGCNPVHDIVRRTSIIPGRRQSAQYLRTIPGKLYDAHLSHSWHCPPFLPDGILRAFGTNGIFGDFGSRSSVLGCIIGRSSTVHDCFLMCLLLADRSQNSLRHMGHSRCAPVHFL